MEAGQIIDFRGGPALRSAPGNYLQYTATGTARLRYMSGATEVFSATDNGSLIAGKGSAGATTDTGGYLLIPFCAGTPTGVPANAALGIALRYDTTAHKLWAYDNGTSTWKGVALT
jgi:hypothetical protein